MRYVQLVVTHTVCSLVLLLCRTNVPWNIRSLEWKFPGTFILVSESSHSQWGAKIPGSEKSLNRRISIRTAAVHNLSGLVLSLLTVSGTFVLKTIRFQDSSFPWWNFRSLDRSREHLFRRMNGPWNIRSLDVLALGNFLFLYQKREAGVQNGQLCFT